MTLTDEARGHQTISRRGLADQIYDVLLGRIIEQHYGPGVKLNIDALARELGVSSSPVREALAKLAAVKLAVANSYVGYSIAPVPDNAWFEEAWRFRSLMEPWAAGEAAIHRPADEIARMHTSMDSLRELLTDAPRVSRPSGIPAENYAIFKTDVMFHRAVLHASRNRVMIRSFEEMNVHLQFARLAREMPERVVRVTIAEHEAVVDAIERGDSEAAKAAMANHLLQSRMRVGTALEGGSLA